MRQRFLVGLSLLCLTTVSGCGGCGGESAAQRMRRSAELRAQAEKEKEEKAAQGGAAPATEAPATPETTQAPVTPTTPVTSAAPPAVKPAVTPVVTPPAAAPADRRGHTIANLGKVGRGLNAFAEKFAGYPATKLVGTTQYPPMSWRVAILPFIGHEALYNQYRPNEPWNSTNNKLLIAKMPAEYGSSFRTDGKTTFLVPLSYEAAFGTGRRKQPGLFADGLEYTLILVEAADAYAVEWTKPDDLSIQGVAIRPLLAGSEEGFTGVTADSRVVRIQSRATEAQLLAAFSTDGNDVEIQEQILQDITEPFVPPMAVAATPVPAAPAGSPMPATVPGPRVAPAPGAVTTVPRPGNLDEDAESPLKAVSTVKLPVPTESELVMSRALLKEIYQKESTEAKTAEEKRKFAAKLLSDAEKLGEDVAGCYELLRIARDLSASVGDLTAALQAQTRLEEKFAVDVPPLRLKLLKDVQKSNRANATAPQIYTHAEKLVYLALELDNFEVAEDASAMLIASAKKEGNAEHAEDAGKLQKTVVSARKAFDGVPQALKTLESNPDDAKANEKVGAYYCLVKSDWVRGIPLLTKGADLKLRFIVRMDLQPEKTAQEKFDLADQYWDLAEEYKDPQKRGLELRAACWYQKAARDLPPGIAKIKAQKRVEEIVDRFGKEAVEKVSGTELVAVAPAGE